MIRRCLFRYALGCLLAMTLVLEAAAAPRVLVALAEEEGPYGEVAATLRQELATGSELVIQHWRALPSAREEPPDLVVAVGVAALDGMLERLERRGEAWARVPLLAVLVPQAVYEARLGQAGRRPFSAALLDQPLARHLALIRRALPQAGRVGVILGPQTRRQLDQLAREAQARGLALKASAPVAAAEEIYPALRQVTESTDLVLALPDPLIYNGASLQNILLTLYRARLPLVAFSAAQVRAGALAAVYSTPTQVARRAAEMVRHWQATRTLPAAQRPREFEVAVNERVAASLGVWLDGGERIAADLRQQEEGR